MNGVIKAEEGTILAQFNGNKDKYDRPVKVVLAMCQTCGRFFLRQLYHYKKDNETYKNKYSDFYFKRYAFHIVLLF